MNPPLKRPKIEGQDNMCLMGGSFDPGAMTRMRTDENTSNCGNNNLRAAPGEEQEKLMIKSGQGKKYHRHTTYQIQELEALFNENPHPDEKQRLELGRKLNMESRQIKFWFQNRRTQMKAQLERHENISLKQEYDKLRVENMSIKEAMKNPICSKCSGGTLFVETSAEEQHLKIENARLKIELNRACALANKIMCRPFSSLGDPLPPPMFNSDLEFAVRETGSGSLRNVHSALPMGPDLNNSVSDGFSLSRPLADMHPLNFPYDKSTFLELALNATSELIKLAQNDTPLWLRSFEGSGETLNLDEYMKLSTPCLDIKPEELSTNGTRATSILSISSMALVEVLMDADRWAEMFSDMIGRSSTLEVIASGIDGTMNCALQLMQAEIQIVSPLVPVRQVRFLRFCRQHADGVWVVVDVSIDTLTEGAGAQTSAYCRMLPSGCIVQNMPNGCSKVTWVEHCEYDESAIHYLYRPLIRCGMGYGAQRWLANLQKQCDFLDAIRSFAVSGEDDSAVITLNSKRSIAKLAQRMTCIFCAGVCGTVNKWEVVKVTDMDEDAKLLVRKCIPNPGEPSEVVLCAAMSVRMPVQPHLLFDLLQDEHHRSQWDVLSHEGTMQQMICISNGKDCSKSISLLRPSVMSTTDINQKNMLRLQVTSTDMCGSLIVYAAVEMSSMNLVLNGGDPSCLTILPSGFAILPDCIPKPDGSRDCKGSVSEGISSSGSLLTVGFQILLDNLRMENLREESFNTVNTLMSRTIQGIREALGCT